jgi:hypothetical protein
MNACVYFFITKAMQKVREKSGGGQIYFSANKARIAWLSPGAKRGRNKDDKRKISFIDSRAQLEQIVFRVKEINQRLMNKFDYVFCE